MAPWYEPLEADYWPARSDWELAGLEEALIGDDGHQVMPPSLMAISSSLRHRVPARAATPQDVRVRDFVDLAFVGRRAALQHLLAPYQCAAELALAQADDARACDEVLSTLAAFSALHGPVTAFCVESDVGAPIGQLTQQYRPPANAPFAQLKDYIACALSGADPQAQLRFGADAPNACRLPVGQCITPNGDLGRQVALAADAVAELLWDVVVSAPNKVGPAAWPRLKNIRQWAQRGDLQLPIEATPAFEWPAVCH